MQVTDHFDVYERLGRTVFRLMAELRNHGQYPQVCVGDALDGAKAVAKVLDGHLEVRRWEAEGADELEAAEALLKMVPTRGT